MAEDLFAAAADEALERRMPLAARLRPHRLDQVVGQAHLLGPGCAFRTMVEADRLTSIILWGPPGCGKTTLARLVANHTSRHFETLSAVSASVKDVRAVIAGARNRLGERGVGTVLFLDEVHRFNRAQQDSLLPSVEEGLLVLIGATTENPFFEVNAPLLSRSNLFRLHPVSVDEMVELLGRGLEYEKAEATPEAVLHLAERAAGDARRGLTALELAVVLARREATARSRVVVELGHAEAALDSRAHRYGTDEHYDVVSAFIKSIRGSDPDAALHWMMRMLEAGEDARFVARRLVILASEDIGMADPQSLLIADAAARAVEFVGLPECTHNLAQAVVHLATAPKSNRAARAMWDARADVRAGRGGEVPTHLRDAHYKGASGLGHGEGYDYPHDHPDGWVDQQYLPDDLRGTVYYRPSTHGYEARLRTGDRAGSGGGTGSGEYARPGGDTGDDGESGS